VAQNVLKLVHNYFINIRILFRSKFKNFEVMWLLMFLELFDFTWGKVLGS